MKPSVYAMGHKRRMCSTLDTHPPTLVDHRTGPVQDRGMMWNKRKRSEYFNDCADFGCAEIWESRPGTFFVYLLH